MTVMVTKTNLSDDNKAIGVHSPNSLTVDVVLDALREQTTWTRDMRTQTGKRGDFGK